MSTVGKLRTYFSIRELIQFVSELSRFHRIQGTKELIEASNYIRDTASDAGFDVVIHEFSYSSMPPYLPDITGWWVRDGAVELVKPFRKVLSSFTNASTTVVAHSPPGEFEGKVLYISDESKVPDSVDGIVLTHDTSFDMYVKVVRAGAQAIMYFRTEGDPSGIPYLGLFPSRRDLPNMKIPAVAISRSDAEEITRCIEEGEEVVVKGFVKSGYADEPPPARVIEVKIGDGYREVHVVAHYCHPAGTVNDNVSGSAGLLEAVLALDRAIRDGVIKLSSLGRPISAVWVPEYYGSFPLVLKKLNEGIEIAGAINLDMIGEKQPLTNSTLQLVRAPIKLLSDLEALAYYNLVSVIPSVPSFSSPSRLPKVRFAVVNYEVGSDHDAYITLGRPALMINQWPDKYYHSNLDRIDKFSPELASSISLAAISTAVEYSILDKSNRTHLKGLAEKYVRFVSGLDLLNVYHDTRLVRAREEIYNKLNSDGKGGATCSCRPAIVLKRHGLVITRSVRAYASTDTYLKFKLMLRRHRWLRTALNLLILNAYLHREVPLKDAKLDLIGELGCDISDNVLNTLVSVLLEIGIIELR
ncbi:MAG: M28 family peptidase [Desulfurococcales archaeon]|nr:M28 family peptidase [Desulfurococcales archaeon]